ncbi:MAG: NAD-dependent epimerase/dehydratase family protein [Verrucomicrobiales bacterium]
MNKRTRILVTGAAGFIGSHTVDRLLEVNCEVLGVDNLSVGALRNLGAAMGSGNFEFAKADVTDPGALDALCSGFGPEAVVHLAGLVSAARAEADPILNYRLNHQATRIVAEAALRHQVDRIVYASSAAVYGTSPRPSADSYRARPVGLYGKAKHLSEKLLLEYSGSSGLETVCLRYFSAYGSRQDPASPYAGEIAVFAERFSAGLPVTVSGDGKQTRDFVSVADVARANALAATLPEVSSTVCDICTGRPRSLLDVRDMFRARFPDAPEPVFAASGDEGILHPSCGDPARAEEILGFRARTRLEDGIAALFDSANPQFAHRRTPRTRAA